MGKGASCLVIVAIAAALTLSGCINFKDDRGLHKGHYKQAPKDKR